MNWELPDVQAGFRKGRETRNQIANTVGNKNSKRILEKISTSASLTMLKHLTVWITTKRGKFLKRWEYQTTLLVSWDIYMQIKKQQLEPDMEQGCILSLWLFNLYAEYIMWNAGLDEAQVGIKIARRNINNFRYTDDTTLMVESKKRAKEPLDKSERGEWKSWLKTQHSKN